MAYMQPRFAVASLLGGLILGIGGCRRSTSGADAKAGAPEPNALTSTGLPPSQAPAPAASAPCRRIRLGEIAHAADGGACVLGRVEATDTPLDCPAGLGPGEEGSLWRECDTCSWQRGGADGVHAGATQSFATPCPPDSGLTIDALVQRLQAGHGWRNGLYSKLDLSPSAATEDLLRLMFRRMSFQEGRVTAFDIREEREVAMDTGTPYRVVRLDTDMGRVIVLLHYEPHGWWNHAYR